MLQKLLTEVLYVQYSTNKERGGARSVRLRVAPGGLLVLRSLMLSGPTNVGA